MEETITHSFDIKDPIGFCSDIPTNLTLMIKSTLIGRCMNGYFVSEFIELVEYGECTVGAEYAVGGGRIPFVFRARVEQYHANDIIGAVTVQNVVENGIVASALNLSVYIVITPEIASIKVGQIIPVVVLRSKYDYLSKTVAVIGSVFIPSRMFHPLITLTPIVSSDNVEKLLESASEVQLELEKLTKENPKGVSTFSGIIKGGSSGSSSDSSSIMIHDLLENYSEHVGKVVTRLPSLNLHTPVVAFVAPVDSEQQPKEVSVAPNGEIAICVLIRSWISYMKLLISMVKTYNTPAIITMHQNVWRILKQ